VQNLKKDGYKVVGYARKSLTVEEGGRRANLLESMCSNLLERSLADALFVSSHSKANAPFCERD
ncbi:hypothetical protein DM01DRAFT_1268489, partial [Hesseltinella vesiculosa]